MTRKKIAWLLLGGVTALALAALYFSLPRLAGNALLSQAKKLGLHQPRLRVARAGLLGMELADITVGDARDPDLRIDRAAVAYTPLGLLRGRIKRIRLSSFMIRIEGSGDGFRFPGWTVPAPAAPSGAGPIAVGRIDLDDGRLTVGAGKRDFFIPFSASLRAMGSGFDLQAGLRPLGEAMQLQGRLDNKLTSGTIRFAAGDVDLASLTRQGFFGQAGRARGRASLNGEVRLQEGRFAGAELQASSRGELELELDSPTRGELAAESLTASLRLDAGFVPHEIVANSRLSRVRIGALAIESPFGFSLRGRRWPDLELAVNGLRLDRPLPLVVEHASGRISGPWPALKAAGSFRVLAAAARVPEAPWKLGRPYALDGDFQVQRLKNEVSWNLKAGGGGGIALAAGRDFVRGALKLDASLAGDARQGHGSVSVRLAGADLRLADLSARAGELAGSGELAFSFGGDWRARGVLQVRDGRILAAGSSGILAEGIAMRLPWSLPGNGPGKSGSFSIARMQAGGMNGRDISGTLSQEGQGLAFSGLAHSALAELLLSFKGDGGMQAGSLRATAEFLVPGAILPAKTKLQALHSLLQGMEASGRIGAKGTIWATNGRAGGSALLEVANGGFNHAGEGIVALGLQAGIRLDSLFDLITPPSQRLLFRELRWQGNSFRDGEVAFTGQGGGRLFIESGRFSWNHGTITLDPLRFAPGKEWPPVTLRCRDVDLAEMLNALAGEKIVSGEARLSGVIPLKMVDGSPVFLDGYLDTAPGASGRLQVSKPEAISGGQVLVEEAIRDFSYNWIKVRLSGGSDRLNMVISIDGAPSRKLPLRYDQNKKDFVRVPAGKPGVELKGLLLDIRFDDIDLKDLLETGGQVTTGRR